MAIGCIVTIFSLLIFGYTREVASVVTTRGSSAVRAWISAGIKATLSDIHLQHSNLTIFLAVFAVYVLDFAINAIMAVNRALIVDVLPISQQEEAYSWGTRMWGTLFRA